MAKSPTEQIAEIRIDFGILEQRVKTLSQESEVTKADRKTDANDLKELRQQVALLAQRLDDQIKRMEEWDRRRWGLFTLILGAFMSLAAGLVVTAVGVIVTLLRK